MDLRRLPRMDRQVGAHGVVQEAHQVSDGDVGNQQWLSRFDDARRDRRRLQGSRQPHRFHVARGVILLVIVVVGGDDLHVGRILAHQRRDPDARPELAQRPGDRGQDGPRLHPGLGEPVGDLVHYVVPGRAAGHPAVGDEMRDVGQGRHDPVAAWLRYRIDQQPHVGAARPPRADQHAAHALPRPQRGDHRVDGDGPLDRFHDQPTRLLGAGSEEGARGQPEQGVGLVVGLDGASLAVVNHDRRRNVVKCPVFGQGWPHYLAAGWTIITFRPGNGSRW